MADPTINNEGSLSTLDEIQRAYSNLVAQEVFISTQNVERGF
jgi:hypothetical protein